MPPSRPNPRRRFITDLDEIHGVPRISRTAPLLGPASAARPNVRFGSKADILTLSCHVCYSPKSGHWHTTFGCPLCAKSGHRAAIDPFSASLDFPAI
jgi:hypothetical protein